MKSIILLLFVIGVMMVTIGYHRHLLATAETRTIVEYRYVPRSFYEEQLEPTDIHETFYDMFNKATVFDSKI